MIQPTTLPKLSELLKELALSSLRDPAAPPSSEAAHAALLFANVGWNRALGHPGGGYSEVLREFVKEHPSLWLELRSTDPEKLIEAAQRAKLEKYPEDRRIVLRCGIPENERIEVEWCHEQDWPLASEIMRDEYELRRSGSRGPGGRNA